GRSDRRRSRPPAHPQPARRILSTRHRQDALSEAEPEADREPDRLAVLHRARNEGVDERAAQERQGQRALPAVLALRAAPGAPAGQASEDEDAEQDYPADDPVLGRGLDHDVVRVELGTP